MTKILGIETSCDDTGVAIYCSENGLLSNITYNQNCHNEYGGVVPELASRDHIQHISNIINQCVVEAKVALSDIDAIAYTAGPGLNGALLVGAGVANGLAFSLNKPVIPIHHLEGHILSPLLNEHKPQVPFIALLVSGGHSQIILVKQINHYTILGDTLDDAAGEAFDKTAKMLDLPYPGGQYIAQLASKGQDVYKLPRPMLHSNNLNMSFSGLKTAVLNLINQEKKHQAVLNLQTKQNIAKAIEEAITDVLVAKVCLASTQTGINQVVVVGGVSSNITLRQKLDAINQIHTFYPALHLCTDNGAMIAYAGYSRFHLAQYTYNLNVMPRWPLTLLS